MSFVFASVPHDTNGVINGNIALLGSRWSKWGVTWLCCLLTLMLVSCYANSVVSGTIAFLRSRQLKWGVTWLFWSYDTNGAGIGLMWCQQHHQWYHCIPWIKMIGMRWNIPFLVMWPINVVCLYTPHYWTYMSKEKKTSKLQLLLSLL